MKNKELLRLLRILRENLRPDPVEQRLAERSSDWSFWLDETGAQRSSSTGSHRSSSNDSPNGNTSIDH